MSYCVTAGPGLTPITLHSTPNVASVVSMILTLRLISSAMRSRLAVTVSSSAIDGSFQSISGKSSSGSATTRSAAGFSASGSGSSSSACFDSSDLTVSSSVSTSQLRRAAATGGYAGPTSSTAATGVALAAGLAWSAGAATNRSNLRRSAQGGRQGFTTVAK